MMSLVDALCGGDRKALARVLRLLEENESSAVEITRALFQRSGQTWIVGLTGAAGVGKSTLADRLIAHLRERGLKVGVLAIDPSSRETGGALLGDRLRMRRHSLDPAVFIRSFATRGALGGLTRHVLPACWALGAAGFEIILIETTGVGQAEVDIGGLADLTILVTVPDDGDQLQALKAGVTEAADLVVVNKSDHDPAGRAVAELKTAFALSATRRGAPQPILPLEAKSGKGFETLARMVLDRFTDRTTDGHDDEKTLERWRHLILGLITARVYDTVISYWDDELRASASRLASREVDPIDEVDELLERALVTIRNQARRSTTR